MWIDGVAGTIAGNGQPGFANGIRDEVQLNSARGIDFDEEGNLFVADFINNAIRKITPEGVVTTIIKSEGEVSINEGPRLVDGPAGTAQFNGPYGIAVAVTETCTSPTCTVTQFVKLPLNEN